MIARKSLWPVTIRVCGARGSHNSTANSESVLFLGGSSMILVLACALSVALASPALAANYYIVQNTRTDECKVMKKKPKGNTLVLVGDGTAYASKKRASEVMGTIDDCKP
jgi:hypothetical protein